MSARPSPLARSIRHAALALSLCGSALANSAAWAEPLAYSIPAGSLAAAISQFAAASGVTISFSSEETAGLQSAGLQGSFELEQGFAKLLQGSGLRVQQAGEKRYVLIKPQDGNALELGATSVNAAGLGSTTEGTGSYTTEEMQTATRLPLSIHETPQSVTVMTRQRMDDQNMKTLEDVIKNVPGVTVKKDGPQQISFSARGFEVDNLMFDGLPTNYIGYITPSDNLAMYDRVEVVRGATGLMQGAGNPSAAINLVRKKPTRETQVSLTGSTGTWDNYRGELDASGSLNEAGTVRGRVVSAYQDKSSFQDKVTADFGLLYAILEADLNEDTTLTLGASYENNHNRTTWSGMPLAADGSDLGLPRSTYLGNDWEYWDKSNTSVFSEIEHRFDNDWKLRFAVNKAWARMNYLGTQLATNAGARNLNAAEYSYVYDQDAYDLYANGPFQLLGRQHELVVGASHRSSTRDMHGGQNYRVASNIDIYDWKGGAAKPSVPEMYLLGEEISQDGVYVTSRFNLADPLHLIVGSRLDWYDYDALYADTHQKVTRNVTRYAGLIYDLDEHHSIYTSYTDIFKPQTSIDIGGKPLKPIEGKNYEIGIKGEYFNGTLNASAALFQIDQENREKSLDDQTNCPGYPANTCAEASGKVRSKGVDMEINGSIMPNWQAAAGYTYTEAKYKSDTNSANVGTLLDSRAPRHLLKLSSTYHLLGNLEKWRVGASLYRQSGIFSNGTIGDVRYNITQDAYTLVDAMLGYQVSENIDTQINLNNVFDKKYYQSISNRPNNARNLYGDPRNAMFTVKYQF